MRHYGHTMYRCGVCVVVWLCVLPQGLEAKVQKPSGVPQVAATQESDQQISDFSLSGYGEKGKKTWDLAGKSADIFGETVKLKDIIGNLFNEKEKITLVADKGDFNKTSGKVHLESNVTITTSSGARLTTETLDWDREKQIVSTLDKVNIEKENMVTTATGAMGKPNLNSMVLEKDVTVKIHPDVTTQKPGTPANAAALIITCDGPLEVDYQNNVAKFNKNVKADRDGSTIYCDSMEIHFSKKEGAAPKGNDSMMMGSKVNKIIARGNVKVVKGENVSYSDEAVYNAGDQKITLTGKPRLVIYSADDFKQSFGGK